MPSLERVCTGARHSRRPPPPPPPPPPSPYLPSSLPGSGARPQPLDVRNPASSLRAAAALGGYYFNLTNLAPHLDFIGEALPDNYTCTPAGIPTAYTDRASGPDAASRGTQHVLQRIAAAGF